MFLSRQQRNLENIEHRQIVTLNKRRWNNSSKISNEELLDVATEVQPSATTAQTSLE